MRFAFVDTETTGTNAISGRIIEIAIILYEDGQFIDTFETLVNPEIIFDPFITQITGISPHDLVDAPTFEDIALKVRERLDGAVLVAHNARFDYSFIKNEFKRLHIPFNIPQLCTVKLSRALYPHHHHHSLDDIIARFDFTCSARHRALGDAEILVKFYEYLLNNFPEDNLKSAISQIMGHPSIPVHVDTDIFHQLSESPGVYIFYNESHLPLYVGKSKNIKTRVLSHFHGDVSSSKEMKLAQTTYDIKTIPTAGELSALLLESRLVKELQPLHNRMLRQTRQLYYLEQTITPEGYSSCKGLIHKTPPPLDKILGIFKSKRQAQNTLSQIADANSLCPRLLGLEGDGPGRSVLQYAPSKTCFAYHLGKCKGACTGAESPLFYNIRFQQAFSHLKIKKWPFPGPILITEYDPDTDISHFFLVDQWCLVQESDAETIFEPITNDIQAGNLPTLNNSFDLDTYKILKRFIFDPKNQSKIKVLNDYQT